MITKEKLQELYSRAYNGDLNAKAALIKCAGVNPELDEEVFSSLSILRGKDVLAVIKKFAKLGNASAICSYGICLIKRGVSQKSLIKGLCWLEVAGNMGVWRAWSLLSDMHRFGMYGVRKDAILAMQYCVKAYYAGAQGAAHVMAKMLFQEVSVYNHMLGDAFNWCKISASLKPEGDGAMYLELLSREYGEDKLNKARKIIPEEFPDWPMREYIDKYGYPEFSIFDDWGVRA